MFFYFYFNLNILPGFREVAIFFYLYNLDTPVAIAAFATASATAR